MLPEHLPPEITTAVDQAGSTRGPNTLSPAVGGYLARSGGARFRAPVAGGDRPESNPRRAIARHQPRCLALPHAEVRVSRVMLLCVTLEPVCLCRAQRPHRSRPRQGPRLGRPRVPLSRLTSAARRHRRAAPSAFQGAGYQVGSSHPGSQGTATCAPQRHPAHRHDPFGQLQRRAGARLAPGTAKELPRRDPGLGLPVAGCHARPWVSWISVFGSAITIG